MKKSTATDQSHSYRWLWDYHPDVVGLTPRGFVFSSLLAGLMIGVIFSIPSVSQATGISPYAVYLIVSVIVLWLLVSFALGPKARRARWVFYLITFGNLLIFSGVCIAFPVLGGDPKTPLWMMIVLYAVLNGTQIDLTPSWVILFLMVGEPLVTIPYFLSRGADPNWSFAGPLLASGFCFVGYHYSVMRTVTWWRLRKEQEAKLEEAQAKIAALEREQLARDLHDSVGSALSFAGLYGDLLERHAHDPETLRRLARTLSEMAKEGLVDLRGVLNAVAPETSTLSGLTEVIQRIGMRSAEASGATVEVTLSGDGSLQPAAPVRLALVRLFQEALSNALRHGKASRFSAQMSTEGEHVSLLLKDNGVGFDLTQPKLSGLGLSGMRRRVEELGGVFQIEVAPGQGVTVSARLPLDPSKTGAP